MKKFTKAFVICFALSSYCVSVQAQDYILDFNGSTDYVDIGTSANGIRTVEMWFKPDVTISTGSLSDYVSLIGRNDPTQDKEWGLFFSNLGSNDGKLVFFSRQSTTQYYEVASTTTTWTAGTWYHVAGVIDGSSGMKLYVNCTLENTNSACTTAVATDNTYYTAIGRWGDYSGRYFDGKIENVRFWSGALASTDLCDKCGGPSYTTGLVADWEMTNGSGTSLTDNSGNGHTGTLSGAPDWITGGPCNYCLDFDGNGDYVDLGGNAGDSIRTIEMWFRPDSTIDSTNAGYITLIARNDATQDKEFGLYFSSLSGHQGELVFFCRQSTALTEIYSNSHTWTAGTWYYVAAVIYPTGTVTPGPGMYLYINGTQQTSHASSQTSATQTATEITALGTWGNANIRYFSGRLKNVRLWHNAITPTDISNNDCAEPLSTSGLVAYWKFNEGGGTTIYDETNTYNQTVAGNTSWPHDGPSCWYPRLANPNSPVSHTVVSGFELYPNPTDRVLQLNSQTSGQVLVRIYDLSGNIVAEASSMTIDVSSLVPGLYLIELTDETGTKGIKKFIRQ